MNKSQKKEVQRLIEGHKRSSQILENEKFMDGIYESLEAVKRGERGTLGKDLKRKYKRA